MKGIKIKTNKRGICEEFSINEIPLGEGITKLEVVIEAGKPTKLIMELNQNVDIECEDAEIKKQVKN